MMDDIVLVTADSVRRDFVDRMPFISSFDVRTGITAGHYTRPSLASLLSSSLAAAVQSRAVSPTIAECLAKAGYTCIGLAPTAQVDPEFGFAAGFHHYEHFFDVASNPLENRRSKVREYLGKFVLIRKLYRRYFPMEAFLESLPRDDEVVTMAIEKFNDATAPRFLWIHLMESHRPYGIGEDAIPGALDRKAASAGSDSLFAKSTITAEEHELIISKYVDSLRRIDARIERLLDGVDSNPLFVFTSDHGEELGEAGYYYHQGYRRRVPDTILSVPVVFDGFDPPVDRLSLLDIAPTIAAGVGITPPDSWHGNDLFENATDQTLTVAPWHDTATIAWQDFERKLVAHDAEVWLADSDATASVERAEPPEALTQRLRELGYIDAG